MKDPLNDIDDSIYRIMNTIRILCNVPEPQLKFLAKEWINMSGEQRQRYETLELWLISKGYTKNELNNEVKNE